MKWKLVLLGLLTWLSCFQATQGFSDKETTLDGSTYKWTHSSKFPSGMEVSWIGTDPEWITFEMKAPTKGYLSIGFSPSGGMAGADIFLGWVDVDAGIGKAHIVDMFATHNGRPLVDKQQDLELIGGWENENGTGIVFRRRWDTCGGEEDFPIGDDTMRMIWAMEDSDPERKDDGSFHPKFHGKDVMRRGVKSTFMKVKPRHRKFPDEEKVYPKNVFQVDLTVTNVVVPKLETYYHCKILKFPKLPKKHHIIGYRPLISPALLAHVHHISFYKCHVPEVLGRSTKDVFEKYLNQHGGDCYTKESPKEWLEYCFEFRVVTVVGSEGDLYPDHLGDPIGDEDNYFRIEVHYENPQGKQLVDSSGIRLFYTPILRQYDVAVLFTGHRITPFLTIPPHQKAYSTYGFCSSECTRKGTPLGGIKIISVLLHAHLTGRKIVLRHIRHGMELPPIAYDNHIDFNYQHFRFLHEEVTVLPGDELITECTFDTEKNDTFVYGGLSTRREMCEAFLYYYPKSALVDCRSQPDFYTYFKAIGVENATGKLLEMMHLPLNSKLLPANLQDMTLPDDSMVLENGRADDIPHDVFREVIITKPTHLEGINVHRHLMTLNWEDEQFVRSVEKKRNTGYHYMYCSAPGGKKIHLSGDSFLFPDYEPYEVPVKPCLFAGSAASCRYPSAWGISVFIFASASLLMKISLSNSFL